MTGIIIKAILGLFIWMVLPNLIYQKKSKKKVFYNRFITVVCTGLGIIIVVFASIDLIKMLLNFK